MIRSNSLYIVAYAGYSRTIERRIMTGVKARYYRSDVEMEYHGGYFKFRLENGRLPEFQPVVDEAEMREALTKDPGLSAFIM